MKMFQKNTMMYHLIVFAFLFFNGCISNKVSDSLIPKACKDASKSPGGDVIPNFEKDCISTLKGNPESQKVKNLGELAVVGANNAISNVTNVKRLVEKIIRERKYKSRLSKKLLEECLTLYSNTTKFLTSGLNHLKRQKFDNATSEFIDADDGPVVCGMKFNGDNHQISPVKKENDFLLTMIEIPLSFAMDISHAERKPGKKKEIN